MKHTGYTPGPWEIKGYSVFMGNGPNASGANLTKFGALGETEFWANARLIADAPRLAEENERLLGICRAIVDHAKKCEPCEGTGRDFWRRPDACRECGGIGEIAEAGDLIADARAALAGREGDSK